MKIQKSIPKNREFFNEHGSSLRAYRLIGFIGQTLSGLSLAYAVFVLLVAQIVRQGWETFSGVPLVALALIVGLFIELANRVLARKAIKPWVVKNQFEDNADARRRHNILTRAYLLGLVAVASLSYLLSIVGSSYYADASTEQVVEISSDSLQQHYDEQRRQLGQSFAADTVLIAAPFNLRLAAAKTAFKADSSAQMQERRRYYSCAQEGSAYCKRMRSNFLRKIEEARAVYADSVASIAVAKGAALARVLKDRQTNTSSIDRRSVSAVDRAEITNLERRTKREGDAGFKSLVFIILTVAGQTLFYFMVYLELQVLAGSEINEKLEPNEFWNKPSVWAELMATVSWRMERGARRLIRWIFPEPKSAKTAIPYKGLYGGSNGQNGYTANEQSSATNGAVSSSNGHTKTQTIDSSLKDCDECGSTYRSKSWNQRFCSIQCKQNYHAKKHGGVKFKPGRYHGKNSKN
ncbi:MAG: hypothetical protein AAFO91_00550 [Bacteroidota bacterium]